MTPEESKEYRNALMRLGYWRDRAEQAEAEVARLKVLLEEIHAEQVER